MRWKWLAALAPAVLGLLLALLFFNGVFENLVVFMRSTRGSFYLRVDLGTLALFLGITISISLCALIALQNWAENLESQVQSQAADERRRFLRRLDHELKNPLTAIRAGLANMAEAPTPEARQEALESVNAQSLRLTRLVTDLRKLAELETCPLENSQVDMADLLQEAFVNAQDAPEAEERRLTLTLPQAPWPLPKVPGDPDLLFLAMHNLLDNALKFTRPGNTVELRAFEDGASVVVEVADTGPGIPEEEVPHVWEELYRGQGARGVPGSGLGLALVRAIAERHGGSISLRSRAGQGTVFSLRLPVS
jgi:two-component system OmpR family sensor kinase